VQCCLLILPLVVVGGSPEVTDGTLRIWFTPNIKNPATNGVEIIAE
jgi:hypothetical protein